MLYNTSLYFNMVQQYEKLFGYTDSIFNELKSVIIYY